MEASEPKWVNTVLNNIGVNSLRLRGPHLLLYMIPNCINLNKWFILIIQNCNSWIYVFEFQILFNYIWKSPSLSELTPMLFNTVFTHLGPEASNYRILKHNYLFLNDSSHIYRAIDNVNTFLLWLFPSMMNRCIKIIFEWILKRYDKRFRKDDICLKR